MKRLLTPLTCTTHSGTMTDHIIHGMDVKRCLTTMMILTRMMQGAPEMTQGAAKAIYKDVQSVRLDSKLLKTLHPDIYAECSSKTTYKRFSVV